MERLVIILLTIFVLITDFLSIQPIPENVFIVAACNPHRGNSLASHKTWVRSTYYVRPLHPTLKCLMWDYGALNQHQERDYVNAKMKMINKNTSDPEVGLITIVCAHSSFMCVMCLDQGSC